MYPARAGPTECGAALSNVVMVNGGIALTLRHLWLDGGIIGKRKANGIRRQACKEGWCMSFWYVMNVQLESHECRAVYAWFLDQNEYVTLINTHLAFLQPLNKRIPENPKYRHIKATIDTGLATQHIPFYVTELAMIHAFCYICTTPNLSMHTCTCLWLQVCRTYCSGISCSRISHSTSELWVM